jgi:LPS export ABC transporter protein LptC
MRIVLLLSLLGMLVACQQEEGAPTENLLPGPDDGIQSEAYGVKYLFSDSMRVKARLEADHLIEKQQRKNEEEEDSPTETIFVLDQGVAIFFFTQSSRPSSQVEANEGFYFEDRGLAELKGNVQLVNQRGETLETEQLFWDKKNDQIYTDQFVRIQTQGKIITGDSGLVSNTSFTNYEIKGVRGQFEYQEGTY